MGEFSEVLDQRENQGGLSISMATALHLSDRLKVILAQVYESK